MKRTLFIVALTFGLSALNTLAAEGERSDRDAAPPRGDRPRAEREDQDRPDRPRAEDVEQDDDVRPMRRGWNAQRDGAPGAGFRGGMGPLRQGAGPQARGRWAPPEPRSDDRDPIDGPRAARPESAQDADQVCPCCGRAKGPLGRQGRGQGGPRFQSGGRERDFGPSALGQGRWQRGGDRQMMQRGPRGFRGQGLANGRGARGFGPQGRGAAFGPQGRGPAFGPPPWAGRW